MAQQNESFARTAQRRARGGGVPPPQGAQSLRLRGLKAHSFYGIVEKSNYI